LQTQRVSQPPRNNTGTVTGAQVTFGHRVLTATAPAVIDVVTAEKGSDTGAGQRAGVDPRTLQRLPRHLQHQPLLRIHRRSLTRRDPEQLRIETRHILQEPAPTAVRTPHRIRIWIDE